MKINHIYIFLFISFYSCSANIISNTWNNIFHSSSNNNSTPETKIPAPITPETDNSQNPIMKENTVDFSKITTTYRLTLKPGKIFSFTIPSDSKGFNAVSNWQEKTFNFSIEKPANAPELSIIETVPTHARIYQVTIPLGIERQNVYTISLRRSELERNTYGETDTRTYTLGKLEIVVKP
jgi:hypothetical protein